MIKGCWSVLGLCVLVLCLSSCAESARKNSGFCFVQPVSSGSFDGQFLEVKDETPLVLYFSDRPERLVGHMTGAQFQRLWDEGADNFKKTPPNAVLSILDDHGVQDVVLELLSASLNGNIWRYRVSVLSGELPRSFSSSSLFIDSANGKVLGDAPAVAMGNLYFAQQQASVHIIAPARK